MIILKDMTSKTAVKKTKKSAPWWRTEESAKAVCQIPVKPGQICPNCGEGILAYDGLFLLTCPACGYVAEGGVFT
ncbi:MAG TPA: hypothetical protein EYH05_02370 [Anaerolineae bacterium]|nr:hypothetical protein [Anaerolineae bacterium]